MSEGAEDIYNISSGAGPSGLTEHVKREKRIGRKRPTFDPRKLRHDVFAARGADAVVWHVSRDDRMEAMEAGDALEGILRMFGLAKEKPAVVQSFIDAMLFCHTVNSGSTLQPGRSKMFVAGTAFDFMEVVRFLGVDLRRFFRAYADETRRVNQRVLDEYENDSFENRERYEWLMEVAMDRGLFRHPDLAHDSSDKCSGLTAEERSSLATSKTGVFSRIVNAADQVTSNSRVATADGYNSTLGERIA